MEFVLHNLHGNTSLVCNTAASHQKKRDGIRMLNRPAPLNKLNRSA